MGRSLRQRACQLPMLRFSGKGLFVASRPMDESRPMLSLLLILRHGAWFGEVYAGGAT